MVISGVKNSLVHSSQTVWESGNKKLEMTMFTREPESKETKKIRFNLIFLRNWKYSNRQSCKPSRQVQAPVEIYNF